MKNRAFILFLLCLFTFSIPDMVLGNAQKVFDTHEDILLRDDVRSLFPGVLVSLKNPQLALNYTTIGFIVKTPNLLKAYVPAVKDLNLFLDLLKRDDEFKEFLLDDPVRNLLLDPDQIDDLVDLINGAPTTPTSLEKVASTDNQRGELATELKPFKVVVKDLNEEPLPGIRVNFKITPGDGLGDGTLSPTMPAETNEMGRAQATLRLGSELGVYKVEASVVNYPSLTVTFTAAAIAAEPQEPPTPPTLIPDQLEIVSGDGQTGKAGMPLAQPFIVGVKDQNGKAFSGTNVTFTVTKGDGGFPTQAQGTEVVKRTEVVKTNAYGQASVVLMLGSNVGINSVEATISVNRINANKEVKFPTQGSSTFTIKVPFSAIAKSDILPAVYWIENGALCKFEGHGQKKTLVTLDAGWTATSLTVDTTGNKIYWTERQDGENKGRIQSASLSNENVKTLYPDPDKGEMLKSVPNSIVANPVTRKLYWTSSRGKIQSINFDGTGFEGSFIAKEKFRYLGKPEHIALAIGEDMPSGEIYGTAYNETDRKWYIWRTSLSSSISPRLVRALEQLDKLSGLAVAGNKLYWAEEVAGQGKIRSAGRGTDPNGPSVKTLHVLDGGIPAGIAVDAAGSRLYWTSSNGTNSSGSIQRLNLDEPIQIVVGELGNPTGIALGSVPAAAAPARPAAPLVVGNGSAQSVLLANYPNPFNPETWIPYQLSESANVTVSIYAVNGVLVRRLDLGHQGAGVYRSRSRAAYWDGRNAFGERVASGLYFYTLTAGDFTATRKMLIRK